MLLASDIDRGTIGVVAREHVRMLVDHMREPEGIVPGLGHSLIVAGSRSCRAAYRRFLTPPRRFGRSR